MRYQHEAKIAVAFAVAALVLNGLYEKTLGQAWDSGYKTGREAEREDWNAPR